MYYTKNDSFHFAYFDYEASLIMYEAVCVSKANFVFCDSHQQEKIYYLCIKRKQINNYNVPHEGDFIKLLYNTFILTKTWKYKLD